MCLCVVCVFVSACVCDIYVCVCMPMHMVLCTYGRQRIIECLYSAFTLFGIRSLIHSRIAGLYACSNLLSLLPSILVLCCCDETLLVCSLCFILVVQDIISQVPVSVTVLCPTKMDNLPLEQ